MGAHPVQAREARRAGRGRRTGLSLVAPALAALLSGCSFLSSAPSVQPPHAPAIEAEARLWHQASTAFSDGRYAAAVHLYERYLTTYPKSRRVPEAHWELGQSYEQMGEVTAALKEYRTLTTAGGATAAILSTYADRALHRIESLKNHTIPTAGAGSGHTAMYISFASLPPMGQVQTWLRQLSAQGISAVVMDASPDASFSRPALPLSAGVAEQARDQPTGALFATSRAPVVADWLGVVVPQAHELGLSIYAVVDLWRAPLFERRPEFRSLIYDPTRRRLHPWRQFDLLSPATQSLIAPFLTDLARTGVDGMVLRARTDNSFAYEISDSTLRRFEAHFQQPSSDVAQALRDRMAVRPNEPVPTSDKTLWRWVGWKAREELEVLGGWRKQLQKAMPRLRLVLEIHPEALSNPTAALVNWGEDAAEARRRGFDLLLGGTSREASDVRAFAGAYKGWSRDVVQQEKGEPQTLPQGWVMLRTPADHQNGMFLGLAQQADELRTPDIRHLVFVPSAVGTLP